ncbi:hypothetical protein CK203_022050 [Vitis vinifera]|uniref:Uncharacterized protein n=1 Tax=Vitis vinifera TaxID=29760 RepID=A0A438FZN7_VITVI|nr:hypothetical protein CK203_022050 [Vitis vinifera]
MGIGSFGEAEGGGDEFEFMLDVADLLTNNDIEMPSDENIQSYLTSESVELPPFPGSNLLQVTQISSNHHDEYNNYEGLENVQLENHPNLVQPVETSSVNPSLVQPVLHAYNPITELQPYDHEADAPHAENVLRPQNMSLYQSRTLEMVSSIQGCAPLYVDDQSLQNIGNNYFGDNNRQVLNCDSPSQNTVGAINGNSSLVNQQDLTWVPQNQNCPYDPSPQSGPHQSADGQVHQGSITVNVYDPLCSNSLQPQPHSSLRLQQLPIQHQELNQVIVTPTAIAGSPPCFSAPFQMTLPFGPQNASYSETSLVPVLHNVYEPQGHSSMMRGSLRASWPQMQMTQYAFDPHSHNTIPYDQPSLVSRPHQFYGQQDQGHIRPNGTTESDLHDAQIIYSAFTFSFSLRKPPEAQFQGLANQTAGFNVLNPNEVAQQIQIVVSMPQEVHFEVFPSESAGPSLPSNQIQIFVSGLQELQPQGFPTQTAPPIAHNPIQGIYQQSQFMQTEQGFEGLDLQVSVPQLLEGSSSTHIEYRRLAQHTHARPQMELGESSSRPRKRVARRDHQVPSGLNPQQVSDIFQSQGNEAQDNKRRILNGLYDPLYEGTGLPIDPHLRQFVPDSAGSTNIKFNNEPRGALDGLWATVKVKLLHKSFSWIVQGWLIS